MNFLPLLKQMNSFSLTKDDGGRQGYIDQAEQYLSAIEKELPNFFGVLPKAKLVVKRVEAFREQDGAAIKMIFLTLAV